LPQLLHLLNLLGGNLVARLFLVGGDGTDPRKGRMLARRLAVLLVFGLLHGFGIWWGDILSLYAVTGFLMFFCRSWQPKLLMGIGVSLYAAMALSAVPTAAYPFAPPSARAEAGAALIPDPKALADRKAKTLERMAEAKASWAGAYRLNMKEYLNLLSGNPWLIPQTLALMMIGLSLFKSGFLAGKSSNRRYVVAIAAGAAALVPVACLAWQADVLERPVLGDKGLSLLLTPVVSLAYVGGLVLLLRSGAGKLLSPLYAHIATAQAALPYLNPTGSLTFVSAVSAHAAVPGTAGIGAANAAVAALVPILAVELKPLRVNGVSPGVIDTPWWDALPEHQKEAMFKEFSAKTPVGRIGRPEDVAKAIAFLIGDDFITGQILICDGGLRFTA